KRKTYDEFGEEGLRGGFDANQARAYRQWEDRRAASGSSPYEDAPFDLGDLEDFFARNYPDRGSSPRAGRNLRSLVELDFDDALRGKELDFELPLDSARAGSRVTVRIPP